MSKIAIIYWSGTGNTEMMAEAIGSGATSKGATVDIFKVSDITPEAALAYDILALGCPATGSEELEYEEFEPFYKDIRESLHDKKVALFGSHDWGSGEWIEEWYKDAQDAGAILFGEEGLKVNTTSSSDDLEICKDFGAKLAEF